MSTQTRDYVMRRLRELADDAQTTCDGERLEQIANYLREVSRIVEFGLVDRP